MEHDKSDKVLAFDTLYTSNQIQMLKIFLPYVEERMHKSLAVFIKYLEFQYTLSFFKRKEKEINICSNPVSTPPMEELLEEIKCYCSEAERQKINQLAGFKNTMKMMKDLQPLMEMMSTLSPENTEGNFGTNPDAMSEMLKGMLTPEQQTMFEMFNQNL